MSTIPKLLKMFAVILLSVSLVTCISNNSPSCVLLGSDATPLSLFRADATGGCPTGGGGGGGGSCSSTLTPTEVLFSQLSTGAIQTLAINTGGNALALMCTTATATSGQIAVANVSATGANYLYVLSTATSNGTVTATINGFAIGHVTPVTLTPTTPAGQAFTISGSGLFHGVFALQADPNGRFLTLTDSSQSVVHVLLISSVDGTLMEGEGSPFSAPNALFTAVGPTGDFLYCTDNTDDQILIYLIDLTPGNDVLLEEVPFQEPTHVTANYPISMQVSLDGTLLYTANNQSISIYAISPIDGSLGTAAGAASPVTPAPLFSPQFLAIDSTGTYLYVLGSGTEGVLGYTFGPNGSLTLIGGSPFASGAANTITFFAADPSLSVLYIVINGIINPYTISGGSLTPPTATPTFTASTTLAIAGVQ